MKKRVRRAFSLMELLIVIVILGLLAAMIIPNLTGKSEEAKAKLACVNMKSVSDALDMFKVDNGEYPTTEEGLKALLQNPDAEKYKNYSQKGYLGNQNTPKDPWGGEFIYTNDNSVVEIISLGADKKDGGDGENKDIRYSECQKK